MKPFILALAILPLSLGCITEEAKKPAVPPTTDPTWQWVKVDPAPAPAPAKKCKCGDVTCRDGDGCVCKAKDCTCKRAAPKQSSYTEAVATVKREGGPLVVWVGQVCPGCERSMPGCTHCRVPSGFDGRHGPCVIVGVPCNDGEVYEAGQISWQPSQAQIEALVRKFAASLEAPPAPVYAAPVQQQPQQQQRFFGSGGGGFRGGSCGPRG